MKYVIDANGAFVRDELGSVDGGALWTVQPPPQPSWSPRYVGYAVIRNGECVGGRWEDPERPATISTPSMEEAAERLWRDQALALADRAIWTLEDLGQDASAWRAYRVQLRDWPQSGLFPNSAHRPEAPQ